MKKIRTTLVGLHGSTLSVNNQTVTFSQDGVAEVSTEVADKLLKEHSDTYYLDGQPAPVKKTIIIPPAIEESFAEKFAESAAAKKIVKASALTEQPEVELTDEQLQDQIAALQAKLEAKKSLPEGGEGEKIQTAEQITEEQARQEKIAYVVDQVQTLNEEQLKSLLKEGKVSKNKYKDVNDREQLIALLVEFDVIE